LTTPPLEDSGREHELGPLLFEAEESLARGDAEKAVVLASKAVKERPDSLTARALHERARRELLRGRRRERLESRVREAEGLLAAGDAAGAERIVTSALKLIPNHPVALALFARLKERRQQASSAEAWAEQALDRLSQARARRSLEAAQAAMAAGRERAAIMALRRGLRHAPDAPELLAMLQEIEQGIQRGKAGQHAVHAQVRAGLDLLAQGQVEESLKVLRAVLRADPDNLRAQAAIQQVRRTWLRRQAVAAAAPPVDKAPATPAPASRPASPPSPSPAPSSAMPSPPPIPRAAAGAAKAPPESEPSISWQDVEAAALGKPVPHVRPPPRPVPAKPAKVAAPPPATPRAATPKPRAARRALPVALILGIAAVVIGVFVSRGSRQPPAPVAAAPVVAPPVAAAPPTTAPAATLTGSGPLDALEPELRAAIDGILPAYARALETADAELLAQARPDLRPEERARLLAPFTGAVNAATDLRVLSATTRGDLAVVTVLRTEVIVGGPGGQREPTEETLRLWRRRGEWMLVR
jgi:tetratricopeptide (TPR) repeat protein